MRALWVLLCGLAGFAAGLILIAASSMAGEEIRTRLCRLPHVLILLAARQMPAELRAECGSEWHSELDAILDGAEGAPVTGLIKGTRYAASLLLHNRAVCRALYGKASRSPGLWLAQLFSNFLRQVNGIHGRLASSNAPGAAVARGKTASTMAISKTAVLRLTLITTLAASGVAAYQYSTDSLSTASNSSGALSPSAVQATTCSRSRSPEAMLCMNKNRGYPDTSFVVEGGGFPSRSALVVKISEIDPANNQLFSETSANVPVTRPDGTFKVPVTQLHHGLLLLGLVTVSVTAPGGEAFATQFMVIPAGAPLN